MHFRLCRRCDLLAQMWHMITCRVYEAMLWIFALCVRDDYHTISKAGTGLGNAALTLFLFLQLTQPEPSALQVVDPKKVVVSAQSAPVLAAHNSFPKRKTCCRLADIMFIAAKGQCVVLSCSTLPHQRALCAVQTMLI